ncbi:MAG: hypothetical protein RMJ15_10085 [Nitrososphaerota archaeon]|nr:hypothetical protein [Candidatus Bathyarchaeota archaeon]MDW8024063.1 hypothetical protein [Nitrososphaerota archaeon]
MEKSSRGITGREVLGKKVLILGEAGSGKTRLASRLIQDLTAVINPKEVVVIDLAPPRRGVFGGKISDYVDLKGEVRYLSPKRVYTPRLAGRSGGEVLRYAELNRESMEPLFKEFLRSPSKVLVVNDITLYLHAGNLETVLECVKLAETFLATAYYGVKLAEDFGTGISVREKVLTEKLAQHMDLVVQIS